MDAKLVVVGGEAKPSEIKLKLPTVIGRGRDATLTLPHPLVSRQHCELFEASGKLYVRDLSSLNGTFVNNERIEGERELPAGELLTIGTVTFRAVYEDVEAAAVPKGAQVQGQPTAAFNAATISADHIQPADPDTDFAEIPAALVNDEVQEAEPAGMDDNDIPAGIPTTKASNSDTDPSDDDALNAFITGMD